MCLVQGHNIMTLVRHKPMALRSRVKDSTIEPLRSLTFRYSLLTKGLIEFLYLLGINAWWDRFFLSHKVLLLKNLNAIFFSGNFPAISDDLVNSYHLLLCNIDWFYTNALLSGRKDLINSKFSGKSRYFPYTVSAQGT